MIEQLKLDHIQNTFPKLTETNQYYVLGLIEGLKYAQGRDKLVLQIPNSFLEVKQSSLEQKTCT
ncbi:MAG: hypothetical protein FWD13_05335 [Treponema sp.]|nr:hypothetical protein [Treponema sp.]